MGLGIHGIEPWLKGSFFGVEVVENTGKDTLPTDPNWYLDCFTKFKKQNLDLHYAASYYVPTKVLEAFEEQLHKYVKRD